MSTVAGPAPQPSVVPAWARPAGRLDLVVVGASLSLAVLGLVVVHSATAGALERAGAPVDLYSGRQAVALAVGVGAMAVATAVDVDVLRRVAGWTHVVGLAALVAVLSPLGREVNGAQAWIAVGGWQFQPAEVAKAATVVALAAALSRTDGPTTPRMVLRAVGVAGPAIGLILLQPDLGSAVVFAWATAVALFVAGARPTWLATLALTGVAGVVAAVRLDLLAPHQVARITAFLQPGDPALAGTLRYNADQSLIAIGSGGLDGAGLFSGTQTALAYVPENHTDFVFTVVAEELGFLGSAAVLAAFGLLVWRGLRIAARARTRFEGLVAATAVAVLGGQVVLNVGMAVGLLPVVGLPLPFVSYGGTSLVASLALVGLVLNVGRRAGGTVAPPVGR